MEIGPRGSRRGRGAWLPGGLPQAQERYGHRCAARRLGLVCKDGAEPRLVGDSAGSGADRHCRISENDCKQAVAALTLCHQEPLLAGSDGNLTWLHRTVMLVCQRTSVERCFRV